MYTGPEIAATIDDLGVTHVVWVPDSLLGGWEQSLESLPSCRLIRVCREGEAWPLAAGLHLGGKRPVVMIQTTGMFESGDAMRNVLLDLKLPIFAVIGHRSYLVEDSPDTAKRLAEPFLKAVGIEYMLVARPEEKAKLAQFYRDCREAAKPGVVLVAEGSM